MNAMNAHVVPVASQASTPLPGIAPRSKNRWRAYLTLVRASVIVAGIGLAVVIPLGWGSWIAGLTDQTTDNAYLRADTTPVSAEVGGRVTRLLVKDYQHVTAGQLLMVIDPAEYSARVSQAEAGVSAAQAAIRNTQSRIELQHRFIEQAEAGFEAIKADRDLATSENRRQASLTRDGWSTEQRLEAAVADVKRHEAKLQEKGAEIAAQRQQLDVLRTQLEQAEADMASRQAALTLANVELDRTRIVAPIDGVVGASGVREGQYVRGGSQVISIVPLPNLYVVANYKETQLARFRPGQQVSVTVDTFPGKVLTGHVEGLSPATGSEFSLLPADNATGNFTKVAQRVGVRIALDPGGELIGLLRPGMSVVATVHTDSKVEGVAGLSW